MPGNIAAERFLGEVVSGHGVGPGPAAAADPDIFALAAIVFIPFKITKLKEKFRFFPDCLKRSCLDIAGGFGKIAAGLHLAIDVDETDELSGQAAFGAAGGKLQASPLVSFRPLPYPFWRTIR